MEIRLINTDKDFVAVKDRWNNIVNRMDEATPFQTWEWNYYWWKTFDNGDESKLCILEAFINNESYGFAPLIIKNNKVEFIGDVHFDYGSFIYVERKREVFNLFIDYLLNIGKKQKMIINLRNISQSTKQYALFKETSDCSKLIYFNEVVETANISLIDYKSFDDFIKNTGRSLRKKAIKPCINENIEFIENDYSDELWQNVLDIYASRQADRIGYSTLEWAGPIIKHLNRENLIKIGTLVYNDDVIAFVVYFTLKDSYYSWLTAFKKTNGLSLGHFTKYNLIKSGFHKGKKQIDFMRGAYEYKKHWDCNVSYNYEFIIFKNFFQKLKYISYKKIRKVIRDIVYNNKKLKEIYRKHAK